MSLSQILPTMDKRLIVYPISTGDELNIFSSDSVSVLHIMDMEGNIVTGPLQLTGSHNVIDIKQLPLATYIVEVMFQNNKTGRSIFVKT